MYNVCARNTRDTQTHSCMSHPNTPTLSIEYMQAIDDIRTLSASGLHRIRMLKSESQQFAIYR